MAPSSDSGDSTTDPRTPRTMINGIAAVDLAVRVRTASRRLADVAAHHRAFASDPEVARGLLQVQALALELAGIANLATLLPRQGSPGRWALFVAFLRG